MGAIILFFFYSEALIFAFVWLQSTEWKSVAIEINYFLEWIRSQIANRISVINASFFLSKTFAEGVEVLPRKKQFGASFDAKSQKSLISEVKSQKIRVFAPFPTLF